ncbi:hypothetical protein [Paenibacillus sp. UNC496MF]|uniref:hypothetical protein n=1 Tax=Paenibacillus sp. UNC496MF TaxID=1502753 RepID=UPI001C4357D3|nr:hypothetical protein [Paenibacillus sp. UNC496MF]
MFWQLGLLTIFKRPAPEWDNKFISRRGNIRPAEIGEETAADEPFTRLRGSAY